MKEKTPDLKELHTDGGYGSEDNDQKFEELGITHIQTAVRGRKSKVEMKIEETAEGEYEVSCHLKCGNSAVSAHGQITDAHDGKLMADQAVIIKEIMDKYYPGAIQSEPNQPDMAIPE